MLPGRVVSWLLALCDPAGAAPELPGVRLRPPELAVLWLEARRHGVLPAVAANLRRTAAAAGHSRVVAGPPPEAVRAVETGLMVSKGALLNYTGLSLAIRGQQSRIAQALSAEGIPALVLKGAAFADRLYPAPHLRHFTDLDLFVPEEAVPEVDAALESLGYAPAPRPPLKYAEGYGERMWHPPDEGGANLEVHWDLVNSPSLRRHVSVRFRDMQLEAEVGPDGLARPTAASLLLIAAVHGALGHRFDRLQNLCDVCQAARGSAGRTDAGWLSETASRTGASLALTAALSLSGRALGEPACSELLGALDLPPVGRLWSLLLTPEVVVRSNEPVPRLRRQLMRELLKRK
jgi:hypothetical protein